MTDLVHNTFPIDPHQPARLTIDAVARLLPRPATRKWPQGQFDTTVFDRADGASVLWFAPRGADYQTPHDRDEFYVVVSGTGVLEIGDDAIHYEPGDLLYVPRTVHHRFVSPPDDLALWVFFLPHEHEPCAGHPAPPA